MRLSSISVENYRSITKAYKIRLGSTTVLVGPNNEGKSNVLLALVTGMGILTQDVNDLLPGALTHRFRFRLTLRRELYEWKRDFPIHLQQSRPTGQSVITLELELSSDEQEAFRVEIRRNLTGTLPIRIAIGTDNKASVTVHKRGRGAKELSSKNSEIGKFISARMRLEHIPAVRTADSAERVVEELVERELQKVESHPSYQEAVSRVAALQEPTLRALSDNIQKTLVQFLPEVKSVAISVSREEQYRALRQSCIIIVDDGTATELKYKGDGVQSLAALGVMRYASEQESATKHSVIAVEEPESHLHPAAIHQLREVLEEMSAKHQIVVSTHNPLFVERLNIQSNIVVANNKARPARDLAEIRDTLGVKASDNLRNAVLVLVVEGDNDRIALTALLAHAGPVLSAALRGGFLAVDSMHGATNLTYKLAELRRCLCNYYCFLDSDLEAKNAVDKAVGARLVSVRDVSFATCPGKREAELEDLYDPTGYAALLEKQFGILVTASSKFKARQKWSVRTANAFQDRGKLWDERVKAQAKLLVAEVVASKPASALHNATRACFDALVEALTERIRLLRPPVRASEGTQIPRAAERTLAPKA
jgi:putative ATP-dependent endonuclease of the OLD family